MNESSPVAASDLDGTEPEGSPRTLSNLLILLAFVVVVAALWVGKEVLLPVTLAVLLTFVLAPLVGLLRRTGLPRVLAVLLGVALALCVIVGLGGIIAAELSSLIGELPKYQTAIHAKVDAVRSIWIHPFADLLTHLRGEVLGGSDSSQPAGAQAASAPTSMLGIASWISPVLSPVGTTFIVLILTIFLLMQKEDVRDRLIRLFGSGDLQRTTMAMNDAAGRLSRYFLLLLVVNAATGTVIAGGLYLIGVPSPILFGLLTALLRFVPYVGTILAAILATLLAAAVGSGWSMAIWTIGLFVVVEGTVGQLIEPIAYGRNTGLSPLAVIVAALFWTWLWGAVGLLLSTPLTVCLVVLGRHVDQLAFLDILFGDRPALLPEESFYQRMLAADPSEARDAAEQMMKENDCTLVGYYDGIAVKGLRLAARDARRAQLSAQQITRVRETIKELIEDLEEHLDAVRKDPDPGDAVTGPEAAAGIALSWPSDGVALCIGGRGPFDDATSAMLSQLLVHGGMRTRLMSYEAAVRTLVRGLDTAGVRLVCITYLDLYDSPLQLRSFVQRLRQHMPTTPIVIGLWPADGSVPPNAQLRSLVGPENCVDSLRHAVQRAVAATSATPESRAA